MAGRKSTTATAGKSKPKAKAGGRSAGLKSAGAKSVAKVKAVDQVVAAAKVARKSGKKTIPKKSTALKATAKSVRVYDELEQLAAYIDAARREIAHIRPHDVKDEYLPDASDELDAVVEATADATNAIMDSCETIESVMGEVSAETSTKLMDATTRIYEACTFQDITGQRIGKVVSALHNIEERVDALLHTLGDEQAIPKKQKLQRLRPSLKTTKKSPTRTCLKVPSWAIRPKAKLRSTIFWQVLIRSRNGYSRRSDQASSRCRAQYHRPVFGTVPRGVGVLYFVGQYFHRRRNEIEESDGQFVQRVHLYRTAIRRPDIVQIQGW